MRRVRIITGNLQCVIRLDRAADVHLSALIQRPAALRLLMGTQVRRESHLEGAASGSPRKVQHQDEFGGDGAVRFELEQPIALRVLRSGQGIAGSGNGTLRAMTAEPGARYGRSVPGENPPGGHPAGGWCDSTA